MGALMHQAPEARRADAEDDAEPVTTLTRRVRARTAADGEADEDTGVTWM